MRQVRHHDRGTRTGVRAARPGERHGARPGHAISLWHQTGSRIEVSTDLAAVEGADAIYTDVWASMGQEEEAAERDRLFREYQVNADLMATAKAGALFLHCLPAHRGDEVTDEVADAETSVIFDEAENRLWTQMAVIHALCT